MDKELYVMIGDQKYEHSCSTSEFWMQDLDHTLDEEISYEINDSIENFVAFHYNKWRIDPDKEEMYHDLVEILGEHKGLIHMGFNPELMHYEFGGISINSEDVVLENVIQENGYFRFQLKERDQSFLFIPGDTIERYCSIETYDDEETGEIITEYYYDTSKVDMFIKPADESVMSDFLYDLIPKMNQVYEKYGLPQIKK